MDIRTAQMADLPHIQKYDSHIPEARLAESIQNRRVLVLMDGGAVIGTLRWSLFWQSIPFLDLLYLDENYRNNGHGKPMMAHWEKAMANEGYPHVMLSTQEDETAKFFYEKLGYRKIGAFLPPDQEADELIYLKELT